ncbi:MAG TPA: hypothetical protein VJK02_01130 [Anaerolineales bacterium]|nr:hypothetical protein [Anaerolineales bacterium]
MAKQASQPLWGKSIAIWYADELYDADPDALVREAVRLGLSKICPKFGNGTTAWRGLEGSIRAAHGAGLEVWGWWYYYGISSNEGTISGDHAVALGLDGVILDVEAPWEESSSNAAARRAKAERLIKQLRQKLHTTPIGIASWWKPSYHTVPFEVFLQPGYCDLNMQQAYWIGRTSESGGADVLQESVDEYSRLYGWPAEKTVPILAAFGQNYNLAGRTTYWEATVPQMDAANAKARELGCIGEWWWSWNFMLGLAGSVDHQPRPAMLEAIGGYAWGTPSPPPGPPEVPIDEWARAIDAWARTQGYAGPNPPMP